MIVVGVDPGSQVAGLAVLRLAKDSGQFAESPQLLALDVYESEKTAHFPDRLLSIATQIDASFVEFTPEVLVLEEAFTGRNIQSALRLAEIRGAILLLARQRGIAVVQLATRKVKQQVAGNGNAGKESVAQFLKAHFDLGNSPLPMDATDALALAFAYSRLQATAGLLATVDLKA